MRNAALAALVLALFAAVQTYEYEHEVGLHVPKNVVEVEVYYDWLE